MLDKIGVLVTTNHRGVFFGYIEDPGNVIPDTLRLEKARMCLSWTGDIRGVLGLADTNLSAAFDAILSLATSSGATQEELPDTLYVISDMEFDTATRGTLTNFEDAKRKFEAAGYTLPTVVFWNVNSRNDQQPVKFNDKGVCLCSGSSPSILKSILSKRVCTPVDLMLETINSERYSKISV